MNATKFAYITLVLLLSTVLVNSFFIHRTTKIFADSAKSISTDNCEDAGNEFTELFERFRKAQKFINLTVSHDDLTNIEESFAEIIGAAEANDLEGIITAKSRLVDSLEHLGRLSGINLDSIL